MRRHRRRFQKEIAVGVVAGVLLLSLAAIEPDRWAIIITAATGGACLVGGIFFVYLRRIMRSVDQLRERVGAWEGAGPFVDFAPGRDGDY